MIGKKPRVKSEVAELGYISPWKLQQQDTSRDFEIFLSKVQTAEESSSPRFKWARTEAMTALPNRPELFSSKKTARTANPATEFRHSLQRTLNRKFYSRSASLHKTRQHYRNEQADASDCTIFAKRCRESQKLKLITVGNCMQSLDPRYTPYRQPSSPTRACRRKKEQLLKKQSVTQEMLKNEIASHK